MRASFWLPLLAVAATVGSGIMAGLFFAFSTSVMRALSSVTPEAGLVVMQRINVAIVNPLFLLAFLGTGLVSVAVGGLALLTFDRAGRGWLIAGALAYLVGVTGVTAVFNVPLNNALQAVKPDTAPVVWPAYVEAWTPWNHVRTVTALLATVCFAVGLARASGVAW